MVGWADRQGRRTLESELGWGGALFCNARLFFFSPPSLQQRMIRSSFALVCAGCPQLLRVELLRRRRSGTHPFANKELVRYSMHFVDGPQTTVRSFTLESATYQCSVRGLPL